MSLRYHPASRRLAILAPLLLLCGCLSSDEKPKTLDLGVDPIKSPLAKSAAFRDTIGAYAYFEGLRPMRVRGYGLVVGLGKNGSADCPRDVFERLVQRMYKRRPPSATLIDQKPVSPEQLIRSLDTAVVVVEGDIPPAAVKASRFDVGVVALPGTQTKSLRGGWLYVTDLEVFRPISEKASIMGQVLAQAGGPVFVNPFSQGEAATQSNPLRATVVGGGVAVKDRRVRLVLQEPSYRLARRIQDRVNARFAGAKRVADATSPSFVSLRIPEEFADEPVHFLGIVRALYLTWDPKFQADRARLLAEEIAEPGAPHALIALALEGLGRTALPVLDPLYTHADDAVAFHAGAAGLRLGDPVSADALAVHAADSTCLHRFKAIRGLGRARGMASAAMPLRELLQNDDPRVAVAAYEALLDRDDSLIQSIALGRDNFIVDLVPAKRRNLVYVKRAGARRVALIGDDVRCVPPLLYRAPDGSVTINAHPGDEGVTVLRLVVGTQSMSPAVQVPLDVGSLVGLLGREADVSLHGEVVGMGLDYAAVVRALYHLCSDGSIDATFILEEPNAAELFGPARPVGRPESESNPSGS